MKQLEHAQYIALFNRFCWYATHVGLSCANDSYIIPSYASGICIVTSLFLIMSFKRKISKPISTTQQASLVFSSQMSANVKTKDEAILSHTNLKTQNKRKRVHI